MGELKKLKSQRHRKRSLWKGQRPTFKGQRMRVARLLRRQFENDGQYPGPGPYMLRVFFWTFLGIGSCLALGATTPGGDRGTIKMKEHLEKEGRSLDKEKQKVALMMQKLQYGESSLKTAKEDTDKKRRQWAKEYQDANPEAETKKE